MQEFLKVSEVSLINGGYVSNVEGNPVNNEKFVIAQRRAEYVIKLAEATEGKDFKGKKPDSFEEISKSVVDSLNSSKVTKYVETPDEPKYTITEKLKKEALAFMSFSDEADLNKQINQKMTEFDAVHEFETFGLFFEQGIVKLNKIYTIKEILEAITKLIKLG